MLLEFTTPQVVGSDTIKSIDTITQHFAKLVTTDGKQRFIGIIGVPNLYTRLINTLVLTAKAKQ